MENTVVAQIMDLKTKSLKELQAKYEELFNGKKALSSNKVCLWRKISYRLQEIEYQGLPEDVQNQINDLVKRYDPVNNKSMRPAAPEKEPNATSLVRDKRLPIPGSIITKHYKDRVLEIKVLEIGFEFENKYYKTLSSIASHVTGAHWNGYLFFNL